MRSVAFPQVEVGSRLHIRYIVHTEKPVMKDRWSTEIALTPGVFIEKLSVKVKSEVPIYYEMRDPGRQATA